MKSKLVSNDPGAGVHVVILDSGEEAFAALTRFANEARITAASMTAIGAFEKATVGWFDFSSRTYKKIEVAEQCEVRSRDPTSSFAAALPVLRSARPQAWA
jgi:predicted DNA-binding protein with PD1-like motif